MISTAGWAPSPSSGSLGGALDGSFGDRGLVRTDLDGWEQFDAGVFAAARPDGRIVVAGTTSSASASGSPAVNQIMVQYTAAGALDPTFGKGGIVLNPVASSATAAVMKPNGTVVTTGDVRFSGGVRTRSVVLTAYGSDRALDTRFGAYTGGRTHGRFVTRRGRLSQPGPRRRRNGVRMGMERGRPDR